MASGPIRYWSPSPAWEWTKFGNRVACESLVGIRQVRKSLATATSESMSSKWFNGGGLSLLVKAEGIHSKCFQFVFPDECELVVWSLEDLFWTN